MKKLLLFGFAAFILAAQAPPAAAPKPAREDGTYARITIVHGTEPVGDIVFKFFEKEAPLTSANFIGLANGTKLWTDPKTDKRLKKRFYDGLTFHRVIPKFMIQGGDPLGNGTGSVDVVKDEFKNGLIFDVPGRVAMAHAGPGTASSQFFITEVPTPQLNGDYTIFGQVVEGQDLVAKIANFPKNGERPTPAVRMTKVTIEHVGGPAPRTTGTAKGTTAAKSATTATTSATKSGTATKTGTATKAPATKK